MPQVVASLRTSPLYGGIAVIAIAAFVIGCAGPVEREDDPLDAREELQRQRTIQPLDDIDEERRGETAPTLFEFYVDEEGRIRVLLLPYILLDPGAEEPLDDVEHDEFEAPDVPDPEQ